MTALLKSVVEIGSLATLRIPVRSSGYGQITGNITKRYHNLTQYAYEESFIWDGDGRTYEYLGFDAGLPPRRLELDSSQGTIILPNNSLVREMFNQHKGFVEAIVSVTFLFLDGSGETIRRKAQVINSSIEGASISLELGTPIGLLDGGVLTRCFTEKDFPQITNNIQVSIG